MGLQGSQQVTESYKPLQTVSRGYRVLQRARRG